MNFSEVAEVAFTNGPKWGRSYGKFFKVLILQSLFWTYFGTCSVYTVIIATNFKQVIEHQFGVEQPLRLYIAALLIPLILLAWVPNLKYLAPVSMIANLLMAAGLGITFYYLVKDEPTTDVPRIGKVAEFPEFFSITIFAMEAIGVVSIDGFTFLHFITPLYLSISIVCNASVGNATGKSNGNATKLCRCMWCTEFGHVWCHISLYLIGFSWLSEICRSYR